MTAASMMLKVGRHGLLRVQDLRFEVRVKDVKQHYGAELYLVVPTYGTGEQWVKGDRVQLHGERS